MKTEFRNESLKMLPRNVLESLRIFLDINYTFFEDRLKISGLVLEKDGFQIPLHSIEDLSETKDFLLKLKSETVF